MPDSHSATVNDNFQVPDNNVKRLYFSQRSVYKEQLDLGYGHFHDTHTFLAKPHSRRNERRTVGITL